jgi:hypothetical protein
MPPSSYVLFDAMQILLEHFFDNIKNKVNISGGKSYCPMLYMQNKMLYDRAKHVSPVNSCGIIH